MQYRLSSYMIVSDRLKNGGYAVLNGLSGTVELISESLFQVLQRVLETNDSHVLYIENDLLPPDVFQLFIRRGLLIGINHDEEREYARIMASSLHKVSSEHPSAVIVPDLDCNYRCVYCFEKSLQSGLKGRKTKMNKQDIDAVYRSIDQIELEIGPINKTISLFGGEPLLSANKSVVEYIIECGQQRGHNIFASTNGHDLDAYINSLGSDKIEHLQITLDGPPSIHNKRRITLDGSPSFERIVKNIHHAIDLTDVAITLRVNLDEGNFSSFSDLLHIFDQAGWLSNDRVSVKVAMVGQRDGNGSLVPILDINNARRELATIVEPYPSVAIGYPQSHFVFEGFYALISGNTYRLRGAHCTASSGGFVFLPDGTISACWESLGEECSYIGRYSADGLSLDTDKVKQWFGRSADKIDGCLDCKYCLLCAGGCAQQAKSKTGDPYQPYCEDFKETYPWVLAEAVETFLTSQNL